MNPASTTMTDNWEHVQAMCREVLGEPLWRFIEECRGMDQPESHLIAVLHKVQAQYGYLSPTHLDAVVKIVRDYFGPKSRAVQEKFFWRNSLPAYKWIKREPSQPSL